ncbi:3812_t:CDS:2, partial [Diversispora eburnea]
MTDMNNEPYLGYTQHTVWSYSEFLNLYRDVILSSNPFSDDWNTLDLTWSRRFLREAKELKKTNFPALEEKIIAERAHIIGSMSLYGEVAKYNSNKLIEDVSSNPLLVFNEEKGTNLVRKWSNDGEITPTKR